VINEFSGGGATPIAIDSLINMRNIPGLLKPSGYGAAIDFGFVWKPIEHL
jgi:hypothetical protein